MAAELGPAQFVAAIGDQVSAVKRGPWRGVRRLPNGAGAFMSSLLSRQL